MKSSEHITTLRVTGALSALAFSAHFDAIAQQQQSGPPISCATDLVREVVTVTVPTNSSYTWIQGQVPSAGASSNLWFNIPQAQISPGQSSVEVPMHLLPSHACWFRAASTNMPSDVSITKEKVQGGWNINVLVDDRVLRHPDGTYDPTQFGKWTTQDTFDGLYWRGTSYDITPRDDGTPIHYIGFSVPYPDGDVYPVS